MPTRAKDLPGQLLDLQVEFVISELTGERFAAVVAQDVDDVLRVAATRTLHDVVDAERLKANVRRLVDDVSRSALAADVVVAAGDALYDMPASSAHQLGDVVDRESVEALIDAALAMTGLHDRAMDRMIDSPLSGVVAARFVTNIVGDIVQQNRQLAEKVPGVSSLLSIGFGAAAKVRKATVDQFLGDTTDKSGPFAIRRMAASIRDLIQDGPVKGAAMEMCDMHAREPISDLRAYLSGEQLRAMVAPVRDIVLTAGGTEMAGHVLDVCIDSFFEAHGSADIASLLSDLGIERDDLVSAIVDHGTTIINAARTDGELEALIRARLKPFFASQQVRALLNGVTATPRPSKNPGARRAVPSADT